MNSTENSILKIYASSTDKIGQDLIYEHLVLLARKRGITGATVYRGIMGYGSSNQVNSSRFWELTEKLPVIIEMVDKTEILEAFYDFIITDLQNITKGFLITIQPVEIKLRKKGSQK
ncbi:MAG: DUF190 domain-containing protein [Paludibacter sp.]